MKDRLKFRAWDKFNKIMHYDFQFIKSGEEGNDWICFISDKQPMKCDKRKIIFDEPYFRQQIEIMQSTGLKDKNGQLIYEGDIVKFETELLGKPKQIVWDECHYVLKDTLIILCSMEIKQFGLEIIGNIYENPELLKE